MVTALRELRGFIDPATEKQPAEYQQLLRPGDRLHVVDGPVAAHGRNYWQLAGRWPAAYMPLGWYPATTQDGQALEPFVPSCPPGDEPISGGDLTIVAGSEGLACFGNIELTVSGELRCFRATADGGAGGAPWMDSTRFCKINDVLWVYGEAVVGLLEEPTYLDSITGTYEVAGHFDDLAAQGCRWMPIGVSLNAPGGPPDPGAVMTCRQDLVVTSATELP
jgi:hypothetical protein